VIPPPATSTASKGRSQEEGMVVKPSPGLQNKIASAQPLKRQKKAKAVATVSLEVHEPSSSSDHVSVTFCAQPCCFGTLKFLHSLCSAAFDAEISISWH
jgi:hypothetical protein